MNPFKFFPPRCSYDVVLAIINLFNFLLTAFSLIFILLTVYRLYCLYSKKTFSGKPAVIWRASLVIIIFTFIMVFVLNLFDYNYFECIKGG